LTEAEEEKDSLPSATHTLKTPKPEAWEIRGKCIHLPSKKEFLLF
jgi:hypothetical protein